MLPPTLIVVIGVPLASSVQLKFVAFTLPVAAPAGLGDAAEGLGDEFVGAGDAVETEGPALALFVAGPVVQEREVRSRIVVSTNPELLSIFVPPPSSFGFACCKALLIMLVVRIPRMVPLNPAA
jgi:hypothetical protein